MKQRPARRSQLREAIIASRIVAPSLAALGAALGLLQVAPVVRATNRPQPAVIKPMPKPVASEPDAKQYLIVRLMKFASPIRFGDWAWNETRAPLGGPMLVIVDIKSESLAVFRAGHQIGATRIIYGADDKPTPIGIFPITQKKEKHRSNIFVDAPMPYMLRLTNDGITIHGADTIDPGYATNGCIGIPNGFAKRLFAVTSLDDRVIITRGTRIRIGDGISTS